MKQSLLIILCSSLMLLGCKSCKYSLSGINIPPDVKNVSIKYFENKAILVNPSLSQRFTEQLKDKFLRNTSLALVPSDGDFRLSGEIVDYKVQPSSSTSTTGALKNRFIMSVKVNFECPNHKENNFNTVIERFIEFDASQSFQSLEPSLSDEMNNQIIQEIFNKVALKW